MKRFIAQNLSALYVTTEPFIIELSTQAMSVKLPGKYYTMSVENNSFFTRQVRTKHFSYKNIISPILFIKHVKTIGSNTNITLRKNLWPKQ
jgi:hypothetical protein